VWPAGPDPIDLHATWPTPILTRIITSFSPSGGRVALLPWPGTNDRSRPAAIRSDNAIHPEPEQDLAAGVAVIDNLDRAGQVVRVTADPTVAGPGSRPFWADLVGEPDHSPSTVTQPRTDMGDLVVEGVPAVPSVLDLIITSLRPENAGDQSSDLIAFLAARLLTIGGILVVLTHCDWTTGALVDPSGTIVASAQNADLLYLQHIVALHTPVLDGQVTAESTATATDADADADTPTGRCGEERGLSTPHRRVHSDVLVFAHPHNPELPRPAPTSALSATGASR
jgi:hypothetical protein